jgi:F1F0 ATPase subunit 2
MNDVAIFSIVLTSGLLLGTFFFGGLWWTVQKGLTSQNPALWFFGSTLLRTGFAVAGFYFTSRGDWRKFVVCLLGFIIARVVVTRFTRTTNKGIHAP